MATIDDVDTGYISADDEDYDPGAEAAAPDADLDDDDEQLDADLVASAAREAMLAKDVRSRVEALDAEWDAMNGGTGAPEVVDAASLNAALRSVRPRRRRGAPSAESQAAASAALRANASAAALVKQTVTFAGETRVIEVRADLSAAAKESGHKGAAGGGGAVAGLDAAAAELEGGRTLNTLEASSADWDAKKRKEGFADDVERFAKDGFVARQAFLEQASGAQAASARHIRDAASEVRKRRSNKEFERRMGAAAASSQAKQ
ncbi:hypothetical protein FNF28_01855 [Cafeteria roenbergensis]|uniref:BCNT-C domain-containing protein n=1 Tax=Cafeteria roenbergensis TaxID=33653 RepID=A0A5A8DWB6_CAFRO|nr:hypothetical protein FNF28_01855 [Cafeteria roenbergensis]